MLSALQISNYIQKSKYNIRDNMEYNLKIWYNKYKR